MDQSEISSAREIKIRKFLKQIQLDKCLDLYSRKNNSNYFIIINEALTHTSAQKKVNHEKLEFFGDAVLRLAASEYIDRNYPEMKVGERSELRAQLVSDNWLSQIAATMNIKDVLIIGSKATGDKYAFATIQAEAMEALIGAIYKCIEELEPIIHWLNPYWDKASQEVLEDPHRKNPKSALQEWSQSKRLKRPEYKIEKRSDQHGDPEKFFCIVILEGVEIGKGLGRSHQESEKNAAENALKNLNDNNQIINLISLNQ